MECVEYLLTTAGVRATPSVWVATSNDFKMFKTLLDLHLQNNLKKRWNGRLLGEVFGRGSQLMVDLCRQHSTPVTLDTLEAKLIHCRSYASNEIALIECLRQLEVEWHVDINTLCNTNIHRSVILHHVVAINDMEALCYLHRHKKWGFPYMAPEYIGMSNETDPYARLDCIRYVCEHSSNYVNLTNVIKWSYLSGDYESFQWVLKLADENAMYNFEQELFRLYTDESLMVEYPTTRKLKLYLMIGNQCMDHDHRIFGSRYQNHYMLDAFQSVFPIKEFTADEWMTCRQTFSNGLMKLLVQRYVYPRALNVLRWMLKVRPYAWHWYGEWQEAQCAPSGEGRRQDIASFEADADRVFKRTSLTSSMNGDTAR